MERIVIEVSPNVAKAWRKLSISRRKEISKKAVAQIKKEVLEDSAEEYISYLNELRSKMAERGLTPEILNEILNEPR